MIDIDIDTLVGRLMALETSFYELQSRYHSLINDYEQLKELHAGIPDGNWQTLEDIEIDVLEAKHAPPVHPDFIGEDDWYDFARAVEAKLKEKNAYRSGHRNDNGQTNHPSVRNDEH